MATTELSPATEVRKAAYAVLASQGPLDDEALAERLADAGLALGDEPEERLMEVLDLDRVLDLVDGRLVDVLALADGVVFSHQLTADEVASGQVALHPDFTLLESLESAGVAMRTEAGGLEHDHWGDEDTCVLVGPSGWLGRNATVGDLVLIRVEVGRTEVVVEPGPFVARDDAVCALRSAYETWIDDSDGDDGPDGDDSDREPGLDDVDGENGQDEEGEDDDGTVPVELFSVWLEAMAAHPDAFRQRQAPLGRLLADAGLESKGEMVAPVGFDWEQWELHRTVARVARQWELDEMGAMAWTMLSAGYARFVADDLPGELDVDADDAEAGSTNSADVIRAGLAAMLSYGNVARAFVAEALEEEPDLDGSVAAFAQWLLDRASGKMKAGPMWVLSVCAERDGRTIEAETLVSQALAADRDNVLALEDAAWYAADRGDARRAASLLRRADVDDDDEILALFDRFARVPPALVGRNEPCPCGSGRKYKHCHLARRSLPLTERCAFLYQKATIFLQRGRHGPRLLEIASNLAGDSNDPFALRKALRNPIVFDLVLFEDGVWDDFLRDRGMLLPADELLLAQQWLLIDRSVHEVQAVVPGQGFTARDIRTGDAADVTERSASGQLTEGELILARIVPDGTGYQIFGGIEPVSLQQRDPLVELLDSGPDGSELAGWLAAAHAPPRMVNYEREPMVLCTLTYTVDDPAAAAVVLDDILEAANPGQWVENIDTEQMGRSIRGFVRLAGDTITVDTNSDVRADRLRALLEARLPGLRAVDDVRIPAAEALADRAASGLPTAGPEALPQGAEEFMEQFALDYERKWLDMSIPALANLTPRQAAGDPTRREDLLALLAEIERAQVSDAMPAAGAMNADRIRTLLGIT